MRGLAGKDWAGFEARRRGGAVGRDWGDGLATDVTPC